MNPSTVVNDVKHYAHETWAWSQEHPLKAVGGLLATGAAVLAVRHRRMLSIMLQLVPRASWGALKLRLRGMSKETACVEYVRKNAKHGDPQSVLNTIDAFSSEYLMMNVGKVKGAALRTVVRDTNALTIIELGGYCGYSAVLLGSMIRGRRDEGAQVISIEMNETYAANMRQIIDIAGLSAVVRVVVGTAEERLEEVTRDLKQQGKQADVLFLDHWKDRYLPDIKIAEELNLVRHGGIICADNVLFPGAPEYRQYMEGNSAYKSELTKYPLLAGTDIIDGVLVSTRL